MDRDVSRTFTSRRLTNGLSLRPVPGPRVVPDVGCCRGSCRNHRGCREISFRRTHKKHVARPTVSSDRRLTRTSAPRTSACDFFSSVAASSAAASSTGRSAGFSLDVETFPRRSGDIASTAFLDCDRRSQASNVVLSVGSPCCSSPTGRSAWFSFLTRAMLSTVGGIASTAFLLYRRSGVERRVVPRVVFVVLLLSLPLGQVFASRSAFENKIERRARTTVWCTRLLENVSPRHSSPCARRLLSDSSATLTVLVFALSTFVNSSFFADCRWNRIRERQSRELWRGHLRLSGRSRFPSSDHDIPSITEITRCHR